MGSPAAPGDGFHNFLLHVGIMRKIGASHDRSRVPLYLQVASVMRQRIDKGEWREGQKISTLEELEEEFQVARVTVRQAVDMLREEGLLESQQGRGTFVSGRPKNNRWLNLANDFDSVLASIRENVLKRVHAEEDAEKPILRDGEGIPADDYIFIRSVQYNNGEPFSVVNLHLDQSIFARDKKRFMRSPAMPIIVEMNDITITHAHQTLTIGVADQETARLLKIGLGEPTADCHLVLLNEKNIAIYVADIHYIKDCFAFRFDLLGRSGPRGRGAETKRK